MISCDYKVLILSDHVHSFFFGLFSALNIEGDFCTSKIPMTPKNVLQRAYLTRYRSTVLLSFVVFTYSRNRTCTTLILKEVFVQIVPKYKAIPRSCRVAIIILVRQNFTIIYVSQCAFQPNTWPGLDTKSIFL